MNYHELDLALEQWGRWKRELANGLSWRSSGIEAQIMSQEIFGDGNVNGGRNPEAKNMVNFDGTDEMSGKINSIVWKMMAGNRDQAAVLIATYVFKWKITKISTESGKSRHLCSKDLREARKTVKTLIEYT